MIKKTTLQEAMYNALVKASTLMPQDVKDHLEKAYAEETDPLSRKHMEVTLENARLAADGKGLVCADTGFPLFFIRAGNAAQIEGGFGSLWDVARSATADATANGFLRPTMVDPLTRDNPGNNIGSEMPKIHLQFDGNNDELEIIAVPKGGGSEIFGTFYRMMYPSDGQAGIFKFIIESIYNSCYAGKVCPPAIVGVGIGGTADMCMQIAKEAAVLSPVGTHNPDPKIAKMEKELFDAIRQLGVGPMGSRGINAVLSLHIRTAATHTAALPVAINAQCSIGRRWKAKINGKGNISYTGEIDG
jgi:tartrate/fumarate subfamily iron-sulfur-dependent hydro-lyase alpha chain